MWPKEGDMENSLADMWGSSMSKGKFMAILRKRNKGYRQIVIAADWAVL